MHASKLFLISALALGAAITPRLGAQNAEPTTAELKKEIASLRAELEKTKPADAAGDTEEKDESDEDEEDEECGDGIPSDVSPKMIFGTVACDLEKLPELPHAQREELKEWSLLRLGEWNAAARLALAEDPSLADEDHGPSHWTIDLHWSLVRKSDGLTTVCCHVAEDRCGAHPVNFLYAFNFVGDTAAVITPRKLFAGAEVLPALRTLIANHREEATQRCFGDYDAKWEQKMKDAADTATDDDEEDDEEDAPEEAAAIAGTESTDDADNTEKMEESDGDADSDGDEDSEEEEDSDEEEESDENADEHTIDWYKLVQIAVAEDSLLFCFDQGEIGPMSEGALVIPVPASELKELLSPEGRALFGK